jgi:hypothetical protein
MGHAALIPYYYYYTNRDIRLAFYTEVSIQEFFCSIVQAYVCIVKGKRKKAHGWMLGRKKLHTDGCWVRLSFI